MSPINLITFILVTRVLVMSRSSFLLGLVVGVLCVTCSVVAGEDKAQSNNEFVTFDHEGTQRQYLLHVPENLPKGSPLVVFLHGYRGNAKNYARIGMSRVADSKQFAVVYPQGLPDRRGIAHWNARLKLSEVDDIGFLTALVKKLQADHGFSSKQTFASGISNGGYMSYTLISEKPDVFRAAASIIGTMSGEAWRMRDQIKPRPVLQISGLSDRIVPVDGSMSPRGGWGGAPDQKTIIKFFRDLNKTKSEKVIEISPRATGYRYAGGVDGNEVWLYEVKDWGHRVPGARELGVHSVDLVWDFFSRY